MQKKLEEGLFQRLQETYEIALRELNYRPTYFLSSLHSEGAERTAISHILKGPETTGLQRLCLAKRLELSVEAVVLTGPWKDCFPPEVLEKARKTLKDLEHEYVEYSSQGDVQASTSTPEDVTDMPPGEAQPAEREGSQSTYQRDTDVTEWLLTNAGGVCECCDNQGPFKNKSGKPYLEIHHVRPLSDGGGDQIENAVAVCPNCHRSFHHALDSDTRTERLYDKVSRLKREFE